MRCLAMLLCVAATALAAQEPEPPPDSARAAAESMPTPPPPPPTPEQKRFIAGLRTATRGIAQLKDAMSRMTRAGTRDSLQQRRAGRFLAGLCGSSRGFLKRGRPQMSPTVYEDSLQPERLTFILLTAVMPIPTFGPGSSNTWHRYRFVCAPRGPLVSRFLFEPVPGRGDQGRTCPGQCPLVLRFKRYGKG